MWQALVEKRLAEMVAGLHASADLALQALQDTNEIMASNLIDTIHELKGHFNTVCDENRMVKSAPALGNQHDHVFASYLICSSSYDLCLHAPPEVASAASSAPEVTHSMPAL